MSPKLNPNVAWIIASGLVVGYVLGNWLPLHDPRLANGEGPTGVMAHDAPFAWVDEVQMREAGLFAGLSPSQRLLALKVLNSKPCTCGCAHGTIAACKKDDPSCPEAPDEVNIVVREARAGKSYEEIVEALENAQSLMNR
jgi:hypothetical protein